MLAAQVAANPRVQKVAKNILMGGLVLLTGGAAFLLVRSVFRKAAWKGAINDTDDPSSPAYFAQRLYQALNPDTPGGFGTDKAMLRRVLKTVPHRKFWTLIKISYGKLTKGRNLMEDLDGDLTRTEKQGIDMILAVMPANEREARKRDPDEITEAKLHAWAVRVRAASLHETSWIWPAGTDEEAIYEVLEELPSLKAACLLDKTYHELHNKGFFQEMMDEFEGYELSEAFEILQKKPDGRGKSILQIIAYCTQQRQL